MAVQTSGSQDFTMGTTAVWQALWGGVFDTFIRANGWTYVSQTGDGDPSSATPGAAGTYACFRVYSTTVSAETWYMRVDFGYTSLGPSLKIQCGSGNNGSGTLTGQTSTQQTLSVNGSILSANHFYAISSATGRLTFVVANTSAATGSTCWGFVVHGGVNASGAITSGLDLFFDTCTNTYASQFVPVSGTVPVLIATIPCNQSILATNVIGSHTMTFHPFTWGESGGNNPSPAWMIGGTTDFPSTGVTVTSTLYGSTRTYLPLGHTSNQSANLRSCLLYE